VIERDAHDGRAVVVGLSLGGYVAMALAARRPELVSGLVVAGGTAEPVGLRGWFYTGLGALFRLVPERILDAANAWFFRWRYPPSIAGPIVAAGFWFDGGATAVQSLVGERFRPRLAAYDGCSLLINGELDLFFRPGQRAFARAAADARQVTLRRALHLSNLDQPAAFADAVRGFARDVGTRGRD
jgi:pimeloyl-ACP methyl ester carboxylesterase